MRTAARVRMGIVAGLAAVLLGGCVIHTDTFKAQFSRSEDLTVPATDINALDVSTNVGDIRITDFTKQVRATTNVGTIRCTGLRDTVDLHTNVGDIQATHAPDAPAALNATMATDVGSIEFTGPQEISADLTAKANVGEINTNRPITVRGSLNKHSVRASLGQGEGRVNLNSNVGSIRIR